MADISRHLAKPGFDAPSVVPLPAALRQRYKA